MAKSRFWVKLRKARKPQKKLFIKFNTSSRLVIFLKNPYYDLINEISQIRWNNDQNANIKLKFVTAAFVSNVHPHYQRMASKKSDQNIRSNFEATVVNQVQDSKKTYHGNLRFVPLHHEKPWVWM